MTPLPYPKHAHVRYAHPLRTHARARTRILSPRNKVDQMQMNIDS